jgi:anthranilate/para-aminobenzoate synthase component I
VQYQATGAGLVSTSSVEVHLAPGRTAVVLLPAYAPSGVLVGAPQVSSVVLSQ